MNAITSPRSEPAGPTDALGPSPFVLRAPLTCGEYVQGTLDGRPFLVSCVVDAVSRIACAPNPMDAATPSAALGWKSQRAIEMTFERLGIEPSRFAIQAQAELPSGKGYGTSTGDVAGCIQAVAIAATGRLLPAETVGEIACSVEPSDSLMFPDLAAFDYKNGALIERLPSPPAMTILAADAGGRIDTIAFNNIDVESAIRKNKPLVTEAYDLLKTGLRTGSVDEIATAATMSASAHQKVLRNPLWPAAEAAYRKMGAKGLILAHSGTVIGFLFDPLAEEASDLASRIADLLGSSVHVEVLAAAGGGVSLDREF